MTDTAISVFDAHAGHYKALRRRLVPAFDAFYGTAVEALALAGCELRRVLDLGAGTGVLARAVLQANPDSELVLLDGSAAMLEQLYAELVCSLAPLVDVDVHINAYSVA
jgi:tRNA (cmo5U34)-methyltransferase